MSGQGSRHCLVCFFQRAEHEGTSARQASGERLRRAEGTPNPSTVTDYKNISCSTQKEGEGRIGRGSGTTSKLFKKWLIPLLLYLQTWV